jgi:nucleotide-binding universal stress UspA family protein
MQNDSKPYRIVVGVDYSETGRLALEQALDIASRWQSAEVHLVNVLSPIVPTAGVEYVPFAAFPVFDVEGAAKELQEDTAKSLSDYFTRHPNSGAPSRVVCHVRFAAPAQEIAQLAADVEADLVVVGSHGRRGVGRVLLGSVAEGVVRLAPCPVLVARLKRIIEVPRIEPPCPECLKARQAVDGATFWCAQHSERHGQRHTYHQGDRVSADGSMPLVFHR